MILNYLKIGWRNLWNNKIFSLINIISLAIGLSASFVIGLMVYYDFTFDQFHKDGDRIYRVTTDFNSPEGAFYNSGVTVPLKNALKQNAAGLEQISAFFTYNPLKVKTENSDKIFKNPQFTVFADTSYFDIFNYKWLAGTKQNSLRNPNEAVLSQNRAQLYFPNLKPEQIIGKTLIYNDSIPAKITGIVANFTQRTDIVFEEFISLPTASQTEIKNTVESTQWNSTNSASQLFIKIKKSTKLKNIQKYLDQLSKEHEDKELVSYHQENNFHLQPLSELHFDGNYGDYDYSTPQASKSVLSSLGVIAIFLLLLGSINFINLNTAQATQRAKEIGIRKTLGSSRKQLVFQFLAETFLLTLVAALVSTFLAASLLQVFSDFVPKDLHFGLFANPLIIGFACLLIVVVTLFSGIYPALILSHFKPISVLKGQFLPRNNNASFRQALTVFQFVIAQIFIIGTLLVGKQIHFLMNKDMGINTTSISYFNVPWNDDAMNKKLLFEERLKAIPEIQNISLGGEPPASSGVNSTVATYGSGKKVVDSDLELLFGNSQYFDLYGLKLLAGRKPLNDTLHEYVINEAMMKKIGFKNPEEAVGENLNISDEQFLIVGVMADFNQRSLKSTIRPMAFGGDTDREWYSQFNRIHFKIQSKTENLSNTIAKVETIWKSIYPGSDFDIKFMDDTVKQFYDSERRMSILLNWATALSVIISALGLLGLVIHTTARRTKEIGIRKVLGASLAQLSMLLCRDFLKLVAIAFIIAVPLAWWGLNDWLQGYAFKTEMSWWIFALSGLGMILLSLLIMSIKTLATARKNPVKSLRTE
jgi:ABC-type antimicrobial peptide transport system permease subunit